MAKAIADIRSLARSHTTMAINTLAGICREPTAPAAARVSAAGLLLDRGWGKAEQSHELNAEIQITIRQILDTSPQPLSDNPKVIDVTPDSTGKLQGK